MWCGACFRRWPLLAVRHAPFLEHAARRTGSPHPLPGLWKARAAPQRHPAAANPGGSFSPGRGCVEGSPPAPKGLKAEIGWKADDNLRLRARQVVVKRHKRLDAFQGKAA